MLHRTGIGGQGAYLPDARLLSAEPWHGSREIGQFLVSALQILGAVELALGNLAQAKRFYRETVSLCEGQAFRRVWPSL